jgi:hypothetical protein
VVKRSLSSHAEMRYRRRHRARTVARSEIQALLDAGRFQVNPPGRLTIAHEGEQTAGYVVAGEVVFVMQKVVGGEGIVAVTCLRRVRASKEVRHLRRQEARELAWR